MTPETFIYAGLTSGFLLGFVLAGLALAIGRG